MDNVVDDDDDDDDDNVLPTEKFGRASPKREKLSRPTLVGEFLSISEPSVFTEERMDYFLHRYRFSPDVSVIVPSPIDLACDPRDTQRSTCRVFDAAFDACQLLSFSNFTWKLGLILLNQKSYWAMVVYYALWFEKTRLELTLGHLCFRGVFEQESLDFRIVLFMEGFKCEGSRGPSHQ